MIEFSFQTDPVPLLARMRAAPGTRLRCPRPTSVAEENYLLLFEEFAPEFEWIPLGGPGGAYDTSRLGIPDGPILPVTGEFLQSMCDYTVLNRAKATEEHVWVAAACPIERQLLIEEPWAPEVTEARSLFIYPVGDSSTSNHVFSRVWPNLRLIIFHNSDYSVDYKVIAAFLETHPKVHVWAENSVRSHPRIRCVPLGEENRIWRGGSVDYDPPITISRRAERQIEICAPHWGITHEIREQWRKELAGVLTRKLHRAPKMPKEKYLEFLTDCRAMLCPRGNGLDTHRVWECLAKGTWPIVQDNAHTQLLLQQYPSLPLLYIDSPEDLDMSGLDVPEGLPRFHPVLLREYWRVLFDSFLT
jgi:hypothetical protein